MQAILYLFLSEGIQMLTNQEISEIIENAFQPHRCTTEIFDYEQKIRLRIHDENDLPIITMKEVTLSSIRDEGALDSFCKDILHRINNGN